MQPEHERLESDTARNEGDVGIVPPAASARQTMREMPEHLPPIQSFGNLFIQQERSFRYIAELQRSQASVSAKVAHLADALAETNRKLRLQADKSSRECEDAMLGRTLRFAKRRAATILQHGSQELGKRPVYLSERNTVVQVLMKSTPTDCTLQEFQCLAAKLGRRSSLRKNILPFRNISDVCMPRPYYSSGYTLRVIQGHL